MDYFTLFNMPQVFKINKNELSKNFYQLQLQFHPDLFLNKTCIEKKTALEKSIQINNGYKILNNFLSRAIYLLSLKDIKIETEKILLKNNSFVIKYFTLYEELDALKKNNFNEIKLNFFLQKLDNKIIKYKKEIYVAFEQKNYKHIIKVIEKLLFFQKIKSNAKKKYNI